MNNRARAYTEITCLTNRYRFSLSLSQSMNDSIGDTDSDAEPDSDPDPENQAEEAMRVIAEETVDRTIPPPAAASPDKQPVYSAPTGRAGFRRLDANEGPPPAPEFLAGILAAAATSLAWYPEYEALRAAAARAYGIGEAAVLPVNGADEGIRLLLEAFGGPGSPLLLPEPTFPMYRIYAGLTGTPVRAVPLDGNFDLDLPAVVAALAETGLAALVSPGNPSGRRLGEGAVRAVLEAAEGRPVIVDEVYAPFCGQDFVPLLEEYPHLVLVRSLSKAFGVPGLRCGFVLAAPPMVQALDRRRSPYNVSAVAAAAGAAILDSDAGASGRRRAAVAARQALQGWLAAAGISTVPSDTHFCLLRLGTSAGAAADYLRGEGILVRNLEAVAPGWIRVSVTSLPDVEALTAAFLPWWCDRRVSGGQP
jgi:histidinol-phosphate aminotransferase